MPWKLPDPIPNGRADEIGKGAPALRELLGDRIIVKNEIGALVAEAPSSCEITVVAGARYGLYLTEPFRVPLPRSESTKYRD